MSPDLRIAHLYPDLLRTYGDRGNLLALVRRSEWRGFSVEVEPVGRGDRMASGPDIVLIGGGTDRVQEAIGEDLLSRRAFLSGAAEEGTVVLGICGGYQLLGHRYVDAEGREIPGLGLLDAETRAGSPRIIGRVQAEATLWGRSFELFGFENHRGRTVLGQTATALAAVPRKQGNNGEDGTEGAVQGTIVGTYLHGPVLPANPELADAILERALSRATGGEPLAPLDDSAEREAHELARKLKR
ncbi:MAG: glutamine amidotransferase [Actinomycetota bacterium]|nr:glutamine amidotransferase [Actinomycetota bacterium]